MDQTGMMIRKPPPVEGKPRNSRSLLPSERSMMMRRAIAMNLRNLTWLLLDTSKQHKEEPDPKTQATHSSTMPLEISTAKPGVANRAT